MDSMPLNYLVCRSKKHNMLLKDAWPVGRSGTGMMYRCVSCRLEVTEFLNAAGFIVDRKMEYPKGYLAPKGAGRASRERNGAMRLRRARRFIDGKQS